MPSPLPVSTVTMRVAPEPTTPLTTAPATPVVSSEKSEESTPITTSGNVTRKFMLAAALGFALEE